MSQFADDLGSMIGQIRNFRPNLGDSQYKTWINWRLRQIMDSRTFWSDLVKEGILSIPANYVTGTVDVTTGSAVVNGTATAWPVADVVNTDLDQAVEDIGYVEAFPTVMTGITENSYLYIDGGTADAEAVPVVQVKASSFIAKFTKAHAAAATLTQSSLVNQQFRISNAHPIFTVKSVPTTTALELTNAWGGDSLATQTYRIGLMYVVLSSDLKGIIGMKDEQTGYPVRTHVSMDEANFRDPRRNIVTGNPYFNLVDRGANDQGNMLYEIWPAPSDIRQFSYMYWKQWPDLENEGDRPPWFINPSILVYGALADALRFRQGLKDPYHNPALANHYEGRFREGMELAKNSDEAKCLSALSNFWGKGMVPGTADQLQLNDPAWGQLWSGSTFF